MTTSTISRIYARVDAARIAWFLTDVDGRLVGHGVAKSFPELRGVQVRAGVLEVLIAGLNGTAPHDDWRRATRLDREQLDNLTALANHRFTAA